MRRPPALSLHRPWPFLILAAGKDVENRTWRTSYRGSVLLHAARPWDHGQHGRPEDHPLGIVGVADLVDVCVAQVEEPRRVCQCGPWARSGQYHWRLANPHRFAVPVPCPGRQRLWTPPANVWPAVEQALAEAVL